MPAKPELVSKKEVKLDAPFKQSLGFGSYKSAPLVEVGMQILESVKLKKLRNKERLEDSRPTKRQCVQAAELKLDAEDAEE